MLALSLLLYNTALFLLWPLWLIAGRTLPDVKRFQKARSTNRERLLTWQSSSGSRPIWLHAASVGEVDQALAISRQIRAQSPGQRIVLSIFSPSVKKESFDEVDLVLRLPLDLPWVWSYWFRALRPLLFATMTWDLFPNLLHAAKRHNVATLLVNGALAENSARLKLWQIWFWRPIYQMLNGVAAVGEENAQRFRRLGAANVVDLGDSRYDQIFYRIESLTPSATQKRELKLLRSFGTKQVIFASTYAADDSAILPVIARLSEQNMLSGWQWVAFPHHIDEKRLREAETLAELAGVATLRFSALADGSISLKKARAMAGDRPLLLLVDRLGLLAYAYQLASVAYVGGAFHHRIHNSAEPAVFANPVLSGPRIDTSPPALLLEAAGALCRCHSGEELLQQLSALLTDSHARRRCGRLGQQTMQAERGSSERFCRTFLSEVIDKPKPLRVSRSTPKKSSSKKGRATPAKRG